MLQTKKLTIITINWNNVDGLRETLESVVSQLTDTCEFVVIDGASTDGSVALIEAHQKSIDQWISEPKAGIYADMNKGITLATGDYCLFLNSGDWLQEGGLERALAQCSGEDVIYFDSGLSYEGVRTETYQYPAQLTMRSFYHVTIGHQATLIKRELFACFGLYNENNHIHSDYEFWLKTIIAGNCTCKHVPQTITWYDMSGRSSKPSEENAREVADIQARYLPARVLADYNYWNQREKEMQVMNWYRQRNYLYQPLVFFYKIIKNLKNILGIG